MGALEFLMIGIYGLLKFLLVILGFLFSTPIGWVILFILFLILIFSNWIK